MSISFDYQKAVLWGEFIDVAFSMYVPGVTNPAQPINFPKGWKLVKNINADAGVSFFRQKEFIGFVAQSLKDPHRLAVVLHGTEGVMDYIDDFEFLMNDFTLVPNGGRTEYGFTRFYESFSFVDPLSGVSQNLEDYLEELNQMTSFTVTGASLGGALATLHSLVLASRNIPVEAYLFASPMVGDPKFVNTYNSLVPKSYRIVNKPDIVPQLPGHSLGYEHVNTLFEINSLDFPEIKRSIRCFHSINVYVYTLGGTNTNLDSCKVIGQNGRLRGNL
jgi:triacylglycerol lipase